MGRGTYRTIYQSNSKSLKFAGTSVYLRSRYAAALDSLDAMSDNAGRTLIVTFNKNAIQRRMRDVRLNKFGHVDLISNASIPLQS